MVSECHVNEFALNVADASPKRKRGESERVFPCALKGGLYLLAMIGQRVGFLAMGLIEFATAVICSSVIPAKNATFSVLCPSSSRSIL